VGVRGERFRFKIGGPGSILKFSGTSGSELVGVLTPVLVPGWGGC